jgi:GABA(A) receptor-associated protein
MIKKSLYNENISQTTINMLLLKYPSKRPFIVIPTDKNQPLIDKTKYLVPLEITISEFVYILKKRIIIKQNEAIFIFIQTKNDDTIIPKLSERVIDIYEKYNINGHVIIKYSIENTFG